jgi:polysaccharide export outer membrane protein
MMAVRSLVLFFSLVFLTTTGLQAQAVGSEMMQANQPLQYRLGPGDKIGIHVMDLDDVSDKPVLIDPAGAVDLPLIGRITAAGLTIEQFRDALTKKLAKFIESPQIAINVLEYHSQPVSILGAVNSPGIHQLTGPKRLLDVISLAGGLRQDAGDKLTITRQMSWGALPLPNSHADASGQFSIAEVSIESLTTAKNPLDNIFVRPNDTVSVPKAEIVYVMGQVKKAGGFQITSHDSISLLRALALAEGLDHDASPKKARIMRASALGTSSVNEMPVDLQQILAGKAPDVELHADDVLFVPSNTAQSATRRAAEAAIQIATGVAIYRH